MQATLQTCATVYASCVLIFFSLLIARDGPIVACADLMADMALTAGGSPAFEREHLLSVRGNTPRDGRFEICALGLKVVTVKRKIFLQSQRAGSGDVTFGPLAGDVANGRSRNCAGLTSNK